MLSKIFFFCRVFKKSNCPVRIILHTLLHQIFFLYQVKVDPVTGAGPSYFMSYHSASEHSAGFIASLKNGRELAANITTAHNMTQRGYKVFAYSVFYVFYEQVAICYA